MGTLTAGQPRLPHYCEHKLPTSCRLSSIGECCACYDNRAHAPSYSTYIDGIGFVSRGTRWQRYCWFCKEFWEKRVDASGLRPGQTSIPHNPDQTEFLQRWYEFHQGYRLVIRDDGSEDRVAVLGEDLRDVAPGCLPRTLDELRAGRERSEIEERERRNRLHRQAIDRTQPVEQGESLEETLDQMYQAATAEEVGAQQNRDIPNSGDSGSLANNIHAQAMTAVGTRNREYQARRVAALRRELHRMRNGIERVISGLRELGQNVPDHTEASTRLAELGRTLDTITGVPSQEQAQETINSVNLLTEHMPTTQTERTLSGIQDRVDEARQYVEESRRNRDQAASELDAADQELRASQSRLRQIQTEQRTTENYLRLFGTREEMIAQGDSWESPIGGMFTRAMERFRVAEEVRREERTLRQVLEDEDRSADDVARRLNELSSRERDVWGVPRPPDLQQTAITQYLSPNSTESRAPTQGRFGSPQTEQDLRGDEVGLEEYYALLRSQNWSQEPSENNASQATNNVLDTAPGVQDRLERNTALAGMIAEATGTMSSSGPSVSIVAGPPGQQLDEDPYVNNDRGSDAVFVLSAILNSEELRALLPWTNVSIINRLLRSAEGNSLGWADRENIEGIIENADIVWGSQLPAERNRRRRERGELISFTPDAHSMAAAGQIIIHDIEIMAECFQMSAQVRRQSGITAPEQLAMLYRLQRGQRGSGDRAVLASMLQCDATLRRARDIHAQHTGELDEEQAARRVILEADRRGAARRGNHSRAELDAQRASTRTVALAAGRAAMAAGPTALLERMAERDEETMVAYQRLQDNGFVPATSMTNRRLREPVYRTLSLDDFNASPSVSDSEESDREARGLDAKNSGRPEEPMTEEQMMVLLDCRICYSQKASICTVPCGHLAMCQWCSDQHSPTMAHDHTRPRRAAACPVCRKQIRQKVKVIRA